MRKRRGEKRRGRDIMELGIEYIVIISNLLVAVGLFFATLYRIKIEKNQIAVIIKNAEAAEKFKALKQTIKKEKDAIMEMSGKEFLEFLERVVNSED